MAPNHYDDETYEEAEKTDKAALAFAILAFVIAGAAFFLKNSIAVMMNVSAIQLAYLGLVTISGMHPITGSIGKSMKNVIGYNYD